MSRRNVHSFRRSEFKFLRLIQVNNSLSGKLRICPTGSVSIIGMVVSAGSGRCAGRQDRAITASTIKNVSMTYVPRDMSLCLFLSRRGCSKLLTIDNKWRGFTPRSY
jgi:hypothetical protein